MTFDPGKRSPWVFSLALVLCLLVSFLCVGYPIYVMRPFRAQGTQELSIALSVTHFRPAITVISAAASIAALLCYRRVQRRRGRRALAAVGAVCVAILALLARVNVYELMFRPIDRPPFGAAEQVKLDKEEKVIAVKIGGTARAYPVRSMSYHHLINDVVGRAAIVSTY